MLNACYGSFALVLDPIKVTTKQELKQHQNISAHDQSTSDSKETSEQLYKGNLFGSGLS